MDKTFGETITELRIRENITQDSLAHRAGLSRNYIVKLETGEATNPSARIIIQLAVALDIPSDQLLKAFERQTEKENSTCREHT